MPKVSIVIPSYNRADYVPETLDSILSQTFNDTEIVFVDDGSTDNTESILDKYCAQDHRIKYFKQPNSERAVSRSYGISRAIGEYICLVDSDDTWHPTKLAKEVKILDEQKDVGLVYASVNRIDFDSNPIKSAARQHEGYSGWVFYKLLERNFIPSVTPMIRKSILDKVGTQVTDFIPYEDWDFWLRISRVAKFYHIKEPLGDYRIHPQQSVQNVKAERIEEVTTKVLKANTSEDISIPAYWDLIDTAPIVMGNNPIGLDSREQHFHDVAQNAWSLANLRFAYWYIISGKTSEGISKLSKSWSLSSKRASDYRWYGLLVFAFLAPIIGKKNVQNILGSMH